MPLLKDDDLARESARDWFEVGCRRDFFPEENGWNLRHAALHVDEWIGSEAKDLNWAFAAVVAECQISVGDHVKSYDLDLTNFRFDIYDSESSRVLAVRQKAEELRFEFEVISKNWQRETKHLSLISKKVVHNSYLRIIGMGEGSIPLILESLRARPDHWFVALQAITNTDPSQPNDNPSMAREAWLSWGIKQGYID
jgi:hypothetical protein